MRHFGGGSKHTLVRPTYFQGVETRQPPRSTRLPKGLEWFGVCRGRTVTRGVNKVVKEDLKMALERQVSRSQENVVALLRTFLVDEAELLQQNLAT